jgi:hypothetical protein
VEEEALIPGILGGENQLVRVLVRQEDQLVVCYPRLFLSSRNLMIANIPWLPPVPQTPEEWHDWEPLVLEHRLNVLRETMQSAEARAREIARCDLSVEYFANTYGMIYEARGEAEYQDYEQLLDEEWAPEESRSGIIPYIQYPFQIEFFRWLNDRMRSRGPEGDGIVEKCRDMGLSNSAAFWIGHKWLFRKPFQARLLSRNEKLVDETGNPDSLFWKVDTFLMGLPRWLFEAGAPGFDWKQHRLMLRLINPSNGNLISGESTQSDAGRGGRSTIILYDEFAFMDDGEAIWSAGRASTNHRLGITTPSTSKGLDAYNIIHGEEGYEQPAVLAIPWNEHPLHDNKWFEEERRRDKPQRFAQEVLLDWTAGAGSWVYPETHPYTPADHPWMPGGDLIITMDDGFDDDYSIVAMQYDNSTGRIRVLDSYQNSHKPIDFYGYLLRGVLNDQFTYGYREHEFMNFLRNKGPALYYGDAHGAHIEQVSGESIFSHLATKFGINVNYYIGPNSGTRLTFAQRRLQLGKLLPRMDFDNTPGARYVLECLKKHRFKDAEDRDQMREYREPLHSKWSHTVSALEYFAVQFDVFKMTTAFGGGGIKYAGKRLVNNRMQPRA